VESETYRYAGTLTSTPAEAGSPRIEGTNREAVDRGI
jgi:hypothetical protein